MENLDPKRLNPKSKSNPYEESSLIGKILFSWMKEMVSISNKTTWTHDKNYNLGKDETIKFHKDKILNIFKEKKSIIKTIFLHFKSKITAFFLMNIFENLLLFLISLTTAKTYSMLNEERDLGSLKNIIPIGITLLSGGILRTISLISDNYFLYVADRNSTILKTSILAILQEKINKFSVLNNSDKFTEGYITNLIQVDAEALSMLLGNFYRLINCTVGIFGGIFSLTYYTGWRVTTVVILSYILMNMLYIVVFKMKKLVVGNYLKAKDERMTFFRNVIENIEFVKIKALENFYIKEIFDVRNEELKHLKYNSFVQGASTTLALFSFMMATVIMMVYYVYFDSPVLAFAIFAAIKESLNNIQRSFTLFFIIFNYFVGFSVSVNRIDDFLNGEEIDSSYIEDGESGDSDYAIEVTNGNFTWKSVEEKERNDNSFGDLLDSRIYLNEENGDEFDGFLLKNLNFKVKKGEKIMIIGKSCSGKSSLLYSLLGEMVIVNNLTRSKIKRNGRIGYLNQSRWIIGDKVKENITLGKEYDENLMKKSLEISQFYEDLKTFEHGLDTVLGDSGDTVSGGQRARIALARCFYQK